LNVTIRKWNLDANTSGNIERVTHDGIRIRCAVGYRQTDTLGFTFCARWILSRTRGCRVMIGSFSIDVLRRTFILDIARSFFTVKRPIGQWEFGGKANKIFSLSYSNTAGRRQRRYDQTRLLYALICSFFRVCINK